MLSILHIATNCRHCGRLTQVLDCVLIHLQHVLPILMCLMVCTEAVFINRASPDHVQRAPKEPNAVSNRRFPLNAVFQKKPVRSGRSLAQHDEFQTRDTSLADSRQFDCDYFSNHVMPPTRPQKPCFLGTVPTRIVAKEGDSVTLQCVVYNVNFSTVVISWWREGWFRELTLGLETYNARYRLPRVSYQDWSLQISNTHPNDSGIYVCQINLEQTIEKFFEVQINEQHRLSETSKPPEHEFVKDEAFPQGIVPQMRIEGQNEGFVGSQLTLSCFVHNSAQSATTAALVWSHGNGLQRYFLTTRASGRTDLEYLLRPYVDSDPSGKRVPLDIRFAEDEHLRITTTQQGNHTIRSELWFRHLLLQHAGVWRCSKISYPIGPIMEEAKMMVYVRTKKPTILRGEAVLSKMQHSKNGAPAAFSIRNRCTYTLLSTISTAMLIYMVNNFAP